MNKKSQNKNKGKRLWPILVAVGAVLVLMLVAVLLIWARDQKMNEVASFESVSQDFANLYDATVSNYGARTSKLTCSNLNMKFSEGSLVCDARLELEFDFRDNIDTIMDAQLRKSAVFEVISRDNAQTVYGIDSTRWRVKHQESALICTIDRVTYNREQYQNKYQRAVESNRIVVIGNCTSNSLEAMPKGYSYLKN